MGTDFKALAELCEKLEASSKRTLMANSVATFLKRLTADEVGAATSMILGRALPKWEDRTLEVSWATLSSVIKRLTNANRKDLADAFSRTGDIGAATKLVFEASRIRRQTMLVESPLTVLEVRRTFEDIAETTGYGSRERKERLLEALLGRATPVEVKCMVKIMISEMRTGFHEGLMELSVSKAFNIPHEVVRKAGMLVGDVAEVAAIAKVNGRGGVSKLHFRIFRPIKLMLAQRAQNVNEALKEHSGKSAFEHKLDGARIQIHKSGDEVRIYSRRLTDVTESLPEIKQQVQEEVEARKIILEGEVIAVGEDDCPLPFQHLMRRFRRIRHVKKMVARIPVKLYLFDLIYLNDQSMTDNPYVKRRKKLEKIAGGIPLTKQLITEKRLEAEEFLKEAIGEGHEGLMAKRLDGAYTPGVRGKHWLKVKEVLEPLDLVIVAAEYGYGRRHNWLSDYYLAARDAESGEFVIVGKTFKGLTDKEIIRMTERLKALAVNEERGKVTVNPCVVVEVAYNEIQKSSKYKGGMALRFARIIKIRDDKSAEEADTIQGVEGIYEEQFKRKAKPISLSNHVS
ncbi:MAG: ATP-dependent DNA ligase [Candidatus Bathyarchaeota archaeon]|nr:MAG: ATP-dependent DNA ligase [Candidatus Bathyarchaeota archaeon]